MGGPGLRVPLFLGRKSYFGDTTFREGGVYLGIQKTFLGMQYFFGIQRLFSGYKNLFSKYEKKMLAKILKHHENYNNTKIFSEKNVVF